MGRAATAKEKKKRRRYATAEKNQTQNTGLKIATDTTESFTHMRHPTSGNLSLVPD